MRDSPSGVAKSLRLTAALLAECNRHTDCQSKACPRKGAGGNTFRMFRAGT
jgi:hypothetical protein